MEFLFSSSFILEVRDDLIVHEVSLPLLLAMAKESPLVITSTSSSSTIVAVNEGEKDEQQCMVQQGKVQQGMVVVESMMQPIYLCFYVWCG